MMFDVDLGSRQQGRSMITAAQLRAARLLLGIDQRRLAELSGLSVPTIQRMEASETMVRGNVDSLVKLIAAFDAGRDRDDRRRRRQPFAGTRGAAEDEFGFGEHPFATQGIDRDEGRA